MDIAAVRARLEAIQAECDRDGLRYFEPTPSMTRLDMEAWARDIQQSLGIIHAHAGAGLALVGGAPGGAQPPVEPPPPAAFVAPLPPGAVYGQTKWLPGYGCDLFVPRGTPVVAPVDCIVVHVVGGTGLQGGAELILSLPDKAWAWRWRHVQAQGVRVGQAVRQGQTCAIVMDASLDQLGGVPAWAGPMPDGWQHLDLSMNRGTDRFAPTGGGGGNVSAYEWIASLGYSGRVLARTPGPTDAGRSLAEAVALMTPAGD